MLTTTIGTIANNYTLPAVTANFEHPVHLAIRFNRGPCPIPIMYSSPLVGLVRDRLDTSAQVQGSLLQNVNARIQRGFGGKDIEDVGDAFVEFFKLLFRTVYGTPEVTATRVRSYLQPHFFIDDRTYRGGLALGGVVHFEVDQRGGIASGGPFSGDGNVSYRAVYALAAGGGSSGRFVRVLPIPHLGFVHFESDEELIKVNGPSVQREVGFLLGDDCRGQGLTTCAVEQIETELNRFIGGQPRPGQDHLPREERVSVQRSDIRDVLVLPDRVDFVLWRSACGDIALRQPEVGFETGAVPPIFNGEVPFCSVGQKSL
jgi:hypothetical protein